MKNTNTPLGSLGLEAVHNNSKVTFVYIFGISKKSYSSVPIRVLKMRFHKTYMFWGKNKSAVNVNFEKTHFDTNQNLCIRFSNLNIQES